MLEQSESVDLSVGNALINVHPHEQERLGIYDVIPSRRSAVAFGVGERAGHVVGCIVQVADGFKPTACTDYEHFQRRYVNPLSVDEVVCDLPACATMVQAAEALLDWWKIVDDLLRYGSVPLTWFTRMEFAGVNRELHLEVRPVGPCERSAAPRPCLSR